MKLNLGCGSHKLDGYVGCDIISHPEVDVVCSVDALPFDDSSIEEVLCEHLIEHLTFEQFNRAVIEWRRVLKPGGVLVLECPDLLGLCKQFVESNEFGRYQSYKGFWSIQNHIYGHQRGWSDEEKMSQVHKSGYTEEHLNVVLSGIGFVDIKSEDPVKGVPGTCVLRISAKKSFGEVHSGV